MISVQTRCDFRGGRHGGGGEVDNTFFGADPAELAVAGDCAPECPRISREILQGLTAHQGRKRLDRGHAQFVAAPDGKREAVALQPARMIGAQDDIRGGVIRGGIHGVGPGQCARGRKAEVVRDDLDNTCWHLDLRWPSSHRQC